VAFVAAHLGVLQNVFADGLRNKKLQLKNSYHEINLQQSNRKISNKRSIEFIVRHKKSLKTIQKVSKI
jgi:hypothetical protein